MLDTNNHNQINLDTSAYIMQTQNLINKNLENQKNLKKKLLEINSTLCRLKSNKKYIKNKFLPYNILKKCKSLYSLFQKKQESNDCIFKKIKKLIKRSNIVTCDLFDLENDIWRFISKETGLSLYECYNMWINKTLKNSCFETKELENMARDGKKIDWIDAAIHFRIPPFEIFKQFQKNKLMNQKSKWSKEKDNKLKEAVALIGEGKWAKISKYLATKNAKQCLHRYKNKIQTGFKKGRWTNEEDFLLKEAVSIYGIKNWNKISEYVRTRNDPQCRERYVNILDPTICKSKWNTEDDEKLKKIIKEIGEGNWAVIAKKMGNRTDAQCRRRFLKLNK